MALLALETATRQTGIALIGEDGADLGERTLPPDAKASSALHPAIQALLADAGMRPADLTGLAVSVGPGAFTGLRVGIGTAKGLGFALDLPIWPVNTLTAIAHNLVPADCPVCPLLDVRKGEVCGGVYRPVDGAWHAADPWFCVTPERLANRLPERTLIVGNALERYGELIASQGHSTRPGEIGIPRAAVVARLAHQARQIGKKPVSVDHLRPVYVRDAESEFLAGPASRRVCHRPNYSLICKRKCEPVRGGRVASDGSKIERGNA